MSDLRGSLAASYRTKIEDLSRLRDEILSDMDKERAAVKAYYDVQIKELRDGLEDVNRLDFGDD